MATINVDADYGYGQHEVRNMGYGLNIVTGTIEFDSSYPSGGEDFDLSGFFSKEVITVLFTNRDGYIFEYDKANDTVKVYYADYDASSDGALIEVADGTDLSSLTDVRFIAFGN